MRENTGRWSVTFTGAATIATLLLGAGSPAAQVSAHHQITEDQTSVQAERPGAEGVLVAPARAAKSSKAGTRTTARWANAVDTSSRASVNDAYLSAYAPKLGQLIDWLGGSLPACLPGVSSLRTNQATLSSLNFVRSMAGLAPVSFSPTLNASAQKAALMMAANNALSHSPGRNWRCWSAAGAASAGKSNLVLARPRLMAGQIIDLYMDDPGATNTAAGHRRWILNPFATTMGTGSNMVANALTVIGPTSASQPNPAWVGWPTAGYFPNKLEPDGRWSLSSGLKTVSFSTARVAVYQGGKRIPTRKHPVRVGYAQPTLVWEMPRSFSKTTSYRVVVSGIRQAGSSRLFSTAYTVRLFTPSR